MKLPSYERQNKWMQDYLAPLFDLNFAKMARNYRMNQSKPFTDERMAQIREDVLAGMRESLESHGSADPLRGYTSDHTYASNGDKTRSIRRSSWGGGLNLAPVDIEFITKDTQAGLDKALADAIRFTPDEERAIYAELRKSGYLPFNYLAQSKTDVSKSDR